MFLNHHSKELSVKVVYYGPELAGKKASHQYARSRLQPHSKVVLRQSAMLGRMDFFDFVPSSLGTINGFTCRIHLLVVLEHVAEENTRLHLLKGADGVIFVADSRRQRAEANLRSLEELESNLASLKGHDSAKVARVYSYNKRDLPDALPVAELETMLNPQRKYPGFETIASEGVGVLDSLKAVVKAIHLNARGG
ncbi:gliding-motility protein MglA [Archangium sp.]|uniref:GTP-binding protein n=1 Tax=Archangium sp. TaxID=1872627 RepID=UPI002D648724|nr:gliding-motility protein MglA [Archangium sp.]HYO56584.1 gliding-motility protein MglA [Archangium sp.]